MKILCVDDDPAILAVLEVSLATLGGHDIEKALSGQEALDKHLRSGQDFDCFLLDIQMPGMSGIELCKAIRAIPAYKHIPILMLTAMSDEDYIEDAYRYGATDYVSKPFDPNDLNNRVKTAVARMEQAAALAQAAEQQEIAKRLLAEAAKAQMAAEQTKEQSKQNEKAPFQPPLESMSKLERMIHEARSGGQAAPQKEAEQQAPSLTSLLRKQANAVEKSQTSSQETASQPKRLDLNALHLEPLKPIASYTVDSHEQNAGGVEAVPGQRLFTLEGPIAIQGSDRILAHLTFEKYLETMTSFSKREIGIFSFGIANIDQIYKETTDQEFALFVQEAAEVLSTLLRSRRSLFSYVGNGVFCGTVRGEGVSYVEQLADMFEDLVSTLTPQESLLKAYDAKLVFGGVKFSTMFSTPLKCLRKAVEELVPQLSNPSPQQG